MQEFDRPWKAATPESAWLSVDEQGELSMQITMTTDELCVMARSQEKLHVRTRWIVAAVLVAFAGCFLYNVFSIDEPWIRLGQAWMFGVMCYLFAENLQREPMRIGTNEPCAHFLEREFENKRRGFLAIRGRLFLFIPGIAATCWGGGPMVRAKAMGLDPSSWPFRLVTGTWLLLIVGVILAVVWFAFGKAAEKARRDQQDIRRSIRNK